MKRYRPLLLLLLAGMLLTAGRSTDPERPLTPGAQELVDRALADLQGETLIDCHLHLAGLGTDTTGTWLNPHYRSWRNPAARVRFSSYLQAGGVTDETQADSQYAATLIARLRGLPLPVHGKVFAFDRVYRSDGSCDTVASPLYVSNAAVLALARQHPDVVIPVVSVHPYRRDALAELDRCADAGARMVKWLPNVHGIDPADTRCLPFYEKLCARNMTLITHAGEEKAFAGDMPQEYGNPLRLRLPLDAGCTVIVAHCAAGGEGLDYDHDSTPVANLNLFLRLMAEAKYRGRLFGDISAVTQLNRATTALPVLLAQPELHDRLINGSDYPLPGIDPLHSAYFLAVRGYLTWRDAWYLEEIQAHNPLLYDIVLKRTLRDPRTGSGFAAAVFTDGAL